MITKKIRSPLVVALPAFAMLFAVLAFAAEKEGKHEEEKYSAVGSIRPQGKVAPADLPGLAKISFETALHAAVAAVPGSVIKAELEIEHGSLMYSFDIVGGDRKIKEVEIDAGDGRVLDIDED